MSVKLIYSSPIWLIANGIRYSHDNHHLSDTKTVFICNECYEQIIDNINKKLYCPKCGTEMKIDKNVESTIGTKDYDLIKRVGFKMKHESVLEHSLIVFEFEASRALLQELSRHRIGVSPTVKSTRYTLKELKKEKSFCDGSMYVDFERAKKYVVLTGDIDIDTLIVDSLENLRILCNINKSNDTLKYALPEAFKFKGQYSFNLRSLVHLLELRTNKDVLPEFQQLCKDIIDVLPDDYKELVLTNEKIRTNYERIKNDCKSN